MARFLAVGNLSSQSVLVNSTDMRLFFPHPETEFLNVGPGPDRFSVQKRPAHAIMKDALNGAYELIFAGSNAFPSFNPRKSRVKNLSNLIWKVLRHPNLVNAARFPYSKVGSRLAALDLDDRPVVDNRWFHILDSSICFFKRELPQNPCNAFLYTTAKTECNGNVLHSEKFRRWMKKLRPISLGIEPALCRQYADYKTAKKRMSSLPAICKIVPTAGRE